MNIEKNKLELEKQVKNPNLNLLSTSNEEIMLNADYPRRDWNSITRPISGRPLSIESNKKKVLLERRVEKLSLEGNSKPKNEILVSTNEIEQFKSMLDNFGRELTILNTNYKQIIDCNYI